MQSPARHFHPEELVRIEAIEESDALPPGTTGLFVRRLSDDKLRAIVSRLPGLRHVLTDGNNADVTDAAVTSLATLSNLETLDLEWSSVSDDSLALLAREGQHVSVQAVLVDSKQATRGRYGRGSSPAGAVSANRKT